MTDRKTVWVHKYIPEQHWLRMALKAAAEKGKAAILEETKKAWHYEYDKDLEREIAKTRPKREQ